MEILACPHRAAKTNFALSEATIELDVTLAIRRETPIVAPITMKLVARVTINDGSLVFTTTRPFAKPIRAPAARARNTIGQIGKSYWLVPRARIIDAAPTVDPIDKSNSPEIIKSPTGIATIPSSAARLSQPAVPFTDTKPVPGVASAKNR